MSFCWMFRRAQEGSQHVCLAPQLAHSGPSGHLCRSMAGLLEDSWIDKGVPRLAFWLESRMIFTIFIICS